MQQTICDICLKPIKPLPEEPAKWHFPHGWFVKERPQRRTTIIRGIDRLRPIGAGTLRVRIARDYDVCCDCCETIVEICRSGLEE